MKIYKKVAYRWFKKVADPIKPPPHMIEKAKEFYFKTYAGHVLALTEDKIKKAQENKYQEILDALTRVDKKSEFLWNKLEDSAERGTDLNEKITWNLIGEDRLHISVKAKDGAYVLEWKKEEERRSGRTQTLKSSNPEDILDEFADLSIGVTDDLREQIRNYSRKDANDAYLVDLIRLRERAKPLAGQKKIRTGIVSTDIEVNFKNWAYFDAENPVKKRRIYFEKKVEWIRDYLDQMKKDRKALKEWLERAQVGDQITINLHDIKPKKWTIQKTRDGSLFVPQEKNSFEPQTLVSEVEKGIKELKRMKGIAKDNLETGQSLEKFKKHRKFETITLEFNFKSAGRGGSWDFLDQVIEIVCPRKMPETVEEFEKKLDRIELILLHEMRHFAQSTLSALNPDITGYAGVPSESIRVPHNYSPEGFSRGRERQDHALREIEFQPRIGDEIREFIKSVEGKVKQEDLRDFFDVWTAQMDSRAKRTEFRKKYRVEPRPFFEKLKMRQTKKYQQALTDLYKGLRQRGISF